MKSVAAVQYAPPPPLQQCQSQTEVLEVHQVVCSYRCWSVVCVRTSSPSKGTRSLVSCSVDTQCAMTVSPGCPSMDELSAAPSTDRSQSWVSKRISDMIMSIIIML